MLLALYKNYSSESSINTNLVAASIVPVFKNLLLLNVVTDSLTIRSVTTLLDNWILEYLFK